MSRATSWLTVLFLIVVGAASVYAVLRFNDAFSILPFFEQDAGRPMIHAGISDPCDALRAVMTRVEIATSEPSFLVSLIPHGEAALAPNGEAVPCTHDQIGLSIRASNVELELIDGMNYGGMRSGDTPVNDLVYREGVTKLPSHLSLELPTHRRDYYFRIPSGALASGFASSTVKTLLHVVTGRCIRTRNAGQWTPEACALPTHVTISYWSHIYEIGAALPATFDVGTGFGTILVWGGRPTIASSAQLGTVAGAELRLVHRRDQAIAQAGTIIAAALIGAVLSVLVGAIASSRLARAPPEPGTAQRAGTTEQATIRQSLSATVAALRKKVARNWPAALRKSVVCPTPAAKGTLSDTPTRDPAASSPRGDGGG